MCADIIKKNVYGNIKDGVMRLWLFPIIITLSQIFSKYCAGELNQQKLLEQLENIDVCKEFIRFHCKKQNTSFAKSAIKSDELIQNEIIKILKTFQTKKEK